MKRLLGLLGLTCLLVLTACFYLGEKVAFFLGAGAFLLFVISMFFKSSRKDSTYPIVFITVLVTVSLFLGYTSYYVKPAKAYDGAVVNVVGVQKDDFYRNGFYQYILDVKEINGEDVNCRLRLCSKYALFSEYNDTLEFTNEVSFVENKSLWSDKILLQSYVFDEELVNVKKCEHRPFMYYVRNLRKQFTTALYMEMDTEDAAFSSAVLLGDKDAMSPDSRGLLRQTGLSHIAVVSGLHLSIVAAMCSKLFGKLFKNKIVSGCTTIAGIIFFALLCGFGVPVIRASVMLILYNIGNMIGRRSDSVNSIGAAALLLAINNPFCVGDVGMLLSFAATLGIVLWSDKLSSPVINKISGLKIFRVRLLGYLIRTIVTTISMSLCATIWTLPVAMLTFGGVSTVSLISNLLIVPFMGIVLFIIILCILTHYVGYLAIMCNWLSNAVSLFYDYILFVCRSLVSLPNSYVYTDKTYFYIWLSVTLILISLALIINKKVMNVFVILISALVLFTGSMNYNIARASCLTLHSVDTGKGMTLILEGSDGYAVLRASGSKSKTYILEDAANRMYTGDSNVFVDIEGNNSAVFCDNMLNQFDYEQVLRYYNKDSVPDTHKANDILYFSDMHKLSLWSKADVNIIPAGVGIFEYISAGDMDILVIDDDGDCSMIPKEYTTADIIITDGIPYNYEALECDILYITAEGYIKDATAEAMARICNKIVTDKEFFIDIDI